MKQKLKKYSAITCNCKAITVHNNVDGSQVSMTQQEFEQEFRDLISDSDIDEDFETMTGCNYCDNHWGTDLCACGSGKHPEECEDTPEYEECGQPYYLWTQIL
jgi:hypothetical protein